jgi:hypothetical protein
VNPDDPLERAIGEWQRKYHIADGDPMIAALGLVRVYLKHARHTDDSQGSPIPSFEDFRGTIGLLDRRSKSFITQASDLIGELRRFGQNVERLNRFRLATLFGMLALAAIAGLLIGRSI